MLGWVPNRQVAIRLEAGTESAAGQRVRFAAVRAVLTLEKASTR